MKVLSGKMGEHIVIARRKGNNWYVAGQTNWESRDISFKLDFIENLADYSVEYVIDGVNADKVATDYTMCHADTAKQEWNIHMASGGGFIMKLTAKK
jgi:alpha-glucosidase